jgi:hypothetical protein
MGILGVGGWVRVGWAGWPNRYDRVVAANEVRDVWVLSWVFWWGYVSD